MDAAPGKGSKRKKGSRESAMRRGSAQCGPVTLRGQTLLLLDNGVVETTVPPLAP